jgi:hypothetical protein
MNIEPEDLISPEDEAEMHRNFVMGHGEEVIDTMERMVAAMQSHPSEVSPEAYTILADALANHKLWLRQNGIGLEQPDIDEP